MDPNNKRKITGADWGHVLVAAVHGAPVGDQPTGADWRHGLDGHRDGGNRADEHR